MYHMILKNLHFPTTYLWVSRGFDDVQRQVFPYIALTALSLYWRPNEFCVGQEPNF
jgi:hypothetical protein